MDLLHIHDLKLMTTIGLHHWEQQKQQAIVLDIDLACDCKKIADTDQIELAINYDTICEHLTGYLNTEQTILIETLAEKIAKFLFDFTNSPWLRIKLSKPGATRYAKKIAVSIEREKLP